MRHKNKIINLLAVVFISATLSSSIHVNATDGDPIMDLGIFSWIMYQKKQFFTDIVEISIESNKMHEADVLVSVYQPIIFENKDDTNHRLVFVPDMENKMDFAYTSPVIKAEERWGLEIHSFGVFPYQCSLHPKERGRFTVKL
jgi:plastocyanin